MGEHDVHRHIEVNDGDRPVGSAEVTCLSSGAARG
jgi:hypothetical protein